MVPWWSSNPSTLNSSMESIEVDSEQHRQVRPVQPTAAADHIDGVAVVVAADHGAEEAAQCSNPELLQPIDGIFGIVQHRQQFHPESYKEAKRLLIFAGLLFLLMSTFVLIKFQVAIDDLFRWSPAVWLIGVIICALLMNLSVQIRRFMQRIKANRLRERQNLLFSLNLSTSFSNLSPSQLHEQICWRHRQGFYSANVLPRYEQIHRCPLASPPAFVVCAAADQRQQQRHKDAPPKYKAFASAPRSASSSEEDISPPRYEDCQHDDDGP